MKKMIFSAVALIAFSFAGMANEIEEKKDEEVFIEKDYWDCAKIANDVYHELSEIVPEEEALDNANAYFDHCMGVDRSCQPPFLCN
ncbi:hypothetical protein [Flavobacterium sp.]|uniref:hypothetical protein n=1 Tax=Flavobacterium sp. TaxID=239 RepID=UPI004047408F